MLEPAFSSPIFPPGTPDSKIAAIKKESDAKYQAALQERNQHPENWYNDSLAIIPVGAYLARYAGGECWIIVCKWEVSFHGEIMPLGHIMIWVMDVKDSSVAAYVTCD